MTLELEEEVKKDELDAIREEEDAREKAAAAVEIARQDEEIARKHKEVQMAHQMAELARKQVEEDERQQKEEDERRQMQEEERRKREEAEERAKRQSAKLLLEEKDRQILTAYLRENYPEKLGDVELLLKQFAGNLDVLFEELGKDQKFKESEPAVTVSSPTNTTTPQVSQQQTRSTTSDGGADESMTVHSFRDDETVSPARSSSLATSSPRNEKSFLKPGVDLRSVITSFYSIYAASKLRDIDDILRHFDNREADLFRTLEVKYDVTFATDGTCTANNGDKVGEPFMEASSHGAPAGSSSKFAVDVQSRTLKDKLSKQGQPIESVNVVLSSGSAMM